jgi:hypothetical protein
MSDSPENRKLNAGLVFLSGLIAGVLCYLTAELLTPKHVATPGDHDILLADRLGFIYTPIVGLWLGWLQRSWRRAWVGAGVGLALGVVYMILCASRNFLAIMVGFPCLLGGVMAAATGSNRSPWLRGLAARLGKGLLAGVVLGFVYMVVLNMGLASGILASPSIQFSDETQAYVAMMWRDGPLALGLASALFFVLIRWAVGLTRVRILVFEETPSPTAPSDGGPAKPSRQADASSSPPSC